MDVPLLRFVGLLRGNGLRISPAESVDALQALTLVPLGDRHAVKAALSATLVKEARDQGTFDLLFDTYFSLEDAPGGHEGRDGHHHAHDDDADAVAPSSVKASEEPSGLDDPSHAHTPPADVAKYFEDRDLATARRLHRDGNRIDMSALSQELFLAATRDALDRALRGLRHQIQVSRLRNVASVGDLATASGEVLDAELVVAAVADHLPEAFADLGLDAEAVEDLRRRVDGVIENLPDLLKRYLDKLLALERAPDIDPEPAYRTLFSEEERRRMEEVIRRLARELHGALSYRPAAASRGRIHAARTMRSNLRYGGLPFHPVFVRPQADRPRLLLLVDVSLSVRNTARFTLHLVHGLQSLFSQVRTFAFVADLAEVTSYLERCDLEEALGLIFGGEILDVDANSNYGAALEAFHNRYLQVINRRTTVIVLGDGRGNGNPPNDWALEAIRRRCRQLVWLTPEPRGSWKLGGSDMPRYAEICSKVEVVRSIGQLEAAAEQILRAC